MASGSTILGMEKKQFFSTVMALFIIVIFLGSSLVFLSGDFTADNPDPSTDPVVQNPTTFAFESKSPLSARVSQVFPVVLILAQTNHARIDEIDAELFKLGAVNVVSQYTGQQGSTLEYRAEIQIPTNESANGFLQKVRNESTFLKDVQSAIRGLVQLDSLSPIAMQNPDLNLEQSLTPVEPFVPCLLGENTQKSDQVQINVRAQFAGTTASQIESYEVANLSEQPTSGTVSGQINLDSIEPFIYVSGRVPSSLFGNQTTFQDYVSHLPDSNQVESTLFVSTKVVTLQANPIAVDFDRNEFEEKLSSWSHSDINSYEITDQNEILIQFKLNENSSVGPFMKQLTEQLKLWKLPEDSPITETFFAYQIKATIDGNQTNKIAFNQIKEWLTLRDFNATIQQPGYYFMDALTIDGNQTLDVNQNVTIVLNQAHETGDKINVEWDYDLVRGQISYIQGMES